MYRFERSISFFLIVVTAFLLGVPSIVAYAGDTPPAPDNLKQVSCTEDSVTVAWETTGNWNTYQIIISNTKQENPQFGDEWINCRDVNNMKYTFNHLNCGKTYYVYLRSADVEMTNIYENGHPVTVWDIYGSEVLSITVTPKKENPISVTGKTAKVKYSKVKKKTQYLAVSKIMRIENSNGSLTYKKTSGNKKITINKKTGKVTVKKGIKKSFYTVTVDVSTKGNDSYSPATKSVTFYINVN